MFYSEKHHFIIILLQSQNFEQTPQKAADQGRLSNRSGQYGKLDRLPFFSARHSRLQVPDSITARFVHPLLRLQELAALQAGRNLELRR